MAVRGTSLRSILAAFLTFIDCTDKASLINYLLLDTLVNQTTGTKRTNKL